MSAANPIHVFIDNSNIFGGAQRASQTHEPHFPRFAVRVYIPNLIKLIEGSRPVGTKAFAGSVPPGNDDLWAYAQRHGYNTDLLRRVEHDDGRLVEQGVDELLHLKIANALLDNEGANTLVLATGDGSVSDFGTGFVLQAERALKRGWEVEVWSWRGQLSRNFAKLQVQGRTVTVRELDPFYFSTTFVRAGVYRDGSGKEVHVADRVVSSLPAYFVR
jgi:hypothetical protein